MKAKRPGWAWTLPEFGSCPLTLKWERIFDLLLPKSSRTDPLTQKKKKKKQQKLHFCLFSLLTTEEVIPHDHHMTNSWGIYRSTNSMVQVPITPSKKQVAWSLNDGSLTKATFLPSSFLLFFNWEDMPRSRKQQPLPNCGRSFTPISCLHADKIIF